MMVLFISNAQPACQHTYLLRLAEPELHKTSLLLEYRIVRQDVVHRTDPLSPEQLWLFVIPQQW